MNTINLNPGLAPSITKAASQQTYYTIRFLADLDRVVDAYRAYAYFRWVDDVLDSEADLGVERSVFIQRQDGLLKSCYRGEVASAVNIQEQMLVDLVRKDTEKDSGLRTYLCNMMAVMAFDAERRGKLISQNQLNTYTHLLATAVTEAMHYFIGHDCDSPNNEKRYLAVSAAHITHMLRDTHADIQAGYFNIPREVLDANHIAPQDVESNAYRAWVRSRVQLARNYFKVGRDYLQQVGNLRCRFAGFMYSARFEWLLDTFEREGYLLRPQYNERKSFGTGLRMSFDTLSAIVNWRSLNMSARAMPVRKNS